MVVDGVSDVDICLEGYVCDCRVEVEDIRWCGWRLCVQMCIYTVHKGGLARAGHSDSDDTDWLHAKERRDQSLRVTGPLR
jgi:hypothetical protein